MRLNRLLYQTYSSTYTLKDYSLKDQQLQRDISRQSDAFLRGVASGEASMPRSNME